MGSENVYIGLGSNMDNPLHQIKSAIRALQQTPQIQLLAISNLYRSEPVGPLEQPDFLNAAAHLLTQLEPHDLLICLQQIEDRHQRIREIHWGPRTLDLDILLYGTLELESDTLTIPHPEITNRPFVLQPLADLSPNLILPDGTVLDDLLNTFDSTGLERIMDSQRLLGCP